MPRESGPSSGASHLRWEPSSARILRVNRRRVVEDTTILHAVPLEPEDRDRGGRDRLSIVAIIGRTELEDGRVAALPGLHEFVATTLDRLEEVRGPLFDRRPPRERRHVAEGHRAVLREEIG